MSGIIDFRDEPIPDPDEEAAAVMAWEESVIYRYVTTGQFNDPNEASIIVDWQADLIEDLTRKICKLAEKVEGPLMPIFHANTLDRS